MATFAPSIMLMPNAALAPVRAPAIPSETPEQVAEPLPLALTGVPAAATGTSLPLTSICTGALIFSPPADADPEALPEAAAEPLAAGAALLLDEVSEDLVPQAANVRVAMATRTRAGRIERRCTGHLRRFCSPDVLSGSADDADTRGTYPTDGATSCTGMPS